MRAPPLPTNETQRLAALRSLDLLDSAPEERFDTLTRLASRVFDVPISVVTLVDAQRQWFKSCFGLDESQTPREISFCGHAILSDELFEIRDATRDERFADNPLVIGPPHIRFYAGVPLDDGMGHRLGTLAIVDRRARRLSAGDRALLRDLARLAELELHRIKIMQQREQDAATLRRSEARLLQQEAQLRNADRQKDRFLATLAHELRNPLGPICNSVQIARMRLPGDPLVVQALDVIDRQSRHLTRLVDDLLDVARITEGRLVLDRKPCRLERLVGDAVDAVGAAMRSAGHSLEVELPEPALWLDADPTRLAQALQNLLFNAAKFTPAGGRIAIRARPAGEHVEIAIEDNGIGIAPEQFEHLFEPFAQDQRTLAGRSGGLGIGLSLSRRLVELHGGTLTAHSAGPQLGSRFVITLPVRMAPEPALPPASTGRRVTPKKILVVDDNPDLLLSMQAVLKTLGHSVETAVNGGQALQAVPAWRPDVVLLDIGLPDIDGDEVARELRRRLGEACPALIAVTGWGQAADRQRTAQAGFIRHLTKPVDIDVLQDVIEQVER